MSSNVVFNGVTYSIPDEGDSSWGPDLSAYLVSLAANTFQKSGGSFVLTAETNFGGTFGLKIPYIKSQASNPSATGIVRLGNAENISWRNAANSADLPLSVNASNALQFNGSNVIYAGGGLIVNADVSPSAAIAYSKLNLTGSILNADLAGSIAYSKLVLTGAILNADLAGSIAYSKLSLTGAILNADLAGSIAASKLAAVTASRALVSDASGFLSASSVTSTELGYLSGVTSAIQAQMNLKAPLASPTFTGTVTLPATVVSGAATITLPTATGTVATLAGAEVITNKDIDGGTASNTSRITLPKAAKTTLDALTRKQGTLLFDTTSNKPYYDDGTNLQLVGSGSGGAVNLIGNPDAEAGTTGWATYADAAGVRPVDGTGGTATSVTWTTSATAPLNGSNSFLLTKSATNGQGQGVSFVASLPLEFRAKALTVKVPFIVSSGTFVAGSSSADSDVILYFYDITNSKVVEPSNFKFLSNSTTVSDAIQATVQFDSNCTSFRTILHVASTSASAYVLKLDDIQVGPESYQYGTPVTDWQSYTPTFQGFGTPSSVSTFWRRVGDSVEISASFAAGTLTTVEARIGLPTGLVASSTKIATKAKVGDMAVSLAASTNQWHIYAQAGISYLTVSRSLNGANGTSFVNADTIVNSGDTVTFHAKVPIAGFSSSVQTSDQADTRVVAAVYNTASTTVVNGNSNVTKIPFTNVVKDTHAAYNTATGDYTVPVAGLYRVQANTYTTPVSGTWLLAIFKNGTISSYGSLVQSSFGEQSQTFATLDCVAGDVISIRGSQNSGSGNCTFGTSSASRDQLVIDRISGPSAISASESVNADYSLTSGQVITNGSLTAIIWNSKTYDSHSAMNTTTGEYTIPTSGKYLVTANIIGPGSNTGQQATYLLLNNSNVAILGSGSNSTNQYEVGGSRILNCVAGDKITIGYLQSSGSSYAILNSTLYNYISIAKVGN